MKDPFSTLHHFADNSPHDPFSYYFHPWVGWLFRHRIKMGLDFVKGPYDRLLEVGFGSGFLLPYFAEKAKTVYGLDLESNPMDVHKRLSDISSGSFDLRKGDILHMPYQDNFFDCVVAFSILEHIEDYRTALGELKRVLKPGGVAILGVPAVNKIMEHAFSIIGFKNIQNHHVTAPQEIAKSSVADLTLEATRTLPPHAPIPFSLYSILVFRASK